MNVLIGLIVKVMKHYLKQKQLQQQLNPKTLDVIKESKQKEQDTESKDKSLIIKNLNEFVDIDMAILQKIDEDFDTESRNIILNVLLNCFNYNVRKNNNDLNIFFIPFLPNNEKYYILKIC